MSGTYIYNFLKFGQKEHIFDSYNNGTLYFNTIEFFKKFEDINLRGDDLEGIIEIENVIKAKGKIMKEDGTFSNSFPVKNLRYTTYYTKVPGNIFCLYTIVSEKKLSYFEIEIDKRNLKFGEYCLFIYKPEVFLQKVQETLTSQNFKFHHSFVKYYDKDKFSGKTDMFFKSDTFRYQNEYRIYIYRNDDNAIKIQIGSLREIAWVLKTEDLQNIINVKIK
jgi:hypothetical protein